MSVSTIIDPTSGLIYSSLLPLATGSSYKGLWNASTNTPFLENPAPEGSNGDYYICNVAGFQFNENWATGDYIISNGTQWQRVQGFAPVTSVYGREGAILAQGGDYNASQIYSTDGDVQQDIDNLQQFKYNSAGGTIGGNVFVQGILSTTNGLNIGLNKFTVDHLTGNTQALGSITGNSLVSNSTVRASNDVVSNFGTNNYSLNDTAQIANSLNAIVPQIQQDVLNNTNDITALETKTQNQSANSGATTFINRLVVSNPNDPLEYITLDPNGETGNDGKPYLNMGNVVGGLIASDRLEVNYAKTNTLEVKNTANTTVTASITQDGHITCTSLTQTTGSLNTDDLQVRNDQNQLVAQIDDQGVITAKKLILENTDIQIDGSTGRADFISLQATNEIKVGTTPEIHLTTTEMLSNVPLTMYAPIDLYSILNVNNKMSVDNTTGNISTDGTITGKMGLLIEEDPSMGGKLEFNPMNSQLVLVNNEALPISIQMTDGTTSNYIGTDDVIINAPTTTTKNLTVQGDLNVLGTNTTNNSEVNVYDGYVEIKQNPADGTTPALSIIQTGTNSGAIMRVTDADTNTKFEINQDCDISVNGGKLTIDSATGNLTTDGDVDVAGQVKCVSIDIANGNFTAGSSTYSNVNTILGANQGVEIIEPILTQPRAIPTYSGTTYVVNNLTELQNAHTSAVNGDIIEIHSDIDVSSLGTLGFQISKGIKLTANSKNKKITSNVTNGYTVWVNSENVLIEHITIESLGQGSNEASIYLIGGDGVVNNYVHNCNIITDEFGIIANTERWQITDCFFQYARGTAINESQRFISITRGKNSTCIINNCEFSCFSGSGDSSQQLVNLTGGSNFINCNLIISNCFTTNNSLCQRLMMIESLDISNNNNNFYIYNNNIKGSSGFIIWYLQTFIGNNTFYLVNNAHIVGGNSTGSKGYIGGDFISSNGIIPDLTGKVFAKENSGINLPLRADYTQISIQTDILAVATARFPIITPNSVNTTFYDQVYIGGVLTVENNATFTEPVVFTDTISASNFSGSSSGTNTGDQNTFTNIQGITANSTTTQLNVVGSGGVSISTDNNTKTLTIIAPADQNTFTQIGDITANSSTTNLQLIAGSNITLTQDNVAKSITIASTGGGGDGPTWTDTADTYSIAGNFNQAPSITDVNTLVAGRQIKPLCITNTYALFGRSYTDNGNSPYLIYVYGVSNGTLTFQSQYTYNISPITTTYGINAVASGNNIFVSCAGFGLARVDLLTYNAGTLSQTNISSTSFSNDSYMVMDYKDVYTTGGTTYGVLTWAISYFNISGYFPEFFALWHNQTTNSFTQMANPSFGQPLSTSVGNAGQVKIVGDYSRNLYQIVLYDGAKLYEIGISKNGPSTPSLSQINIFTFSNNFPSSKYNDVSNPTLIVDDEDITTNINFLHIVFPKSQGDTGSNVGGCVLSYRYLLNGTLSGSLDNSQIWQLDDIYTLQTNSFWGGRNSVFNSYTNGNYGFVKNGQMLMPSSGFQGLAQITLNRSSTIPYLTPQPLGSLLYPFNNTPTAPVGGFMTILVSPDGNNMIGVIQNSSGDTNRRIFIYQRGSAGTVSILWKQTSDNIKETNYLAVSDTTGIFKLPVRTLASVQSLFPALQNGFSFIDSTSGTIKVYYNGTFRTITWV